MVTTGLNAKIARNKKRTSNVGFRLLPFVDSQRSKDHGATGKTGFDTRGIRQLGSGDEDVPSRRRGSGRGGRAEPVARSQARARRGLADRPAAARRARPYGAAGRADALRRRRAGG